MKKKRLVCGVGINDLEDYQTQKFEWYGRVNGKSKHKLIWACPIYRSWKNLLARCYVPSRHELFPTYKDKYVCDDWLYFSKYKAWMESQDWQGKHLDKDLLIPNNKVYSPETCVFLTPQENTFLLECNASQGEYMIGVFFKKSSDKFVSQIQNPFLRKREFLGNFDTEQEAHEAWRIRKLYFATKFAEQQTDERIAKALVDRYENYDLYFNSGTA